MTSRKIVKKVIGHKFSDDDKLALFQFYKHNPSLWDQKHPEYRNHQRRSIMQGAIANQIGCSVSSIQSMWNSQRGYFREKWHKYVAGKKRGLDSRELDDIKRWKFWDVLQFLIDDFKNESDGLDIFTDEITITDDSNGEKSDDSDAGASVSVQRTSRSPSTSDSGHYSTRNSHLVLGHSVAPNGVQQFRVLDQDQAALILSANAESGLSALESEHEAIGAKYDSAFLFGMQVCNELRALSPEKRDLATVKITNLLYEIKYSKFAN